MERPPRTPVARAPPRYADAPPSTASQDARVQLKEQVMDLSLRNTSLTTQVAMLELKVRELDAALAAARAPEDSAAPAPGAALLPSADARRAADAASRIAADALRAANVAAAFADGALGMLNTLALAGRVAARHPESIYDASTEQPLSALASDSARGARVQGDTARPSCAARALKRGAASAEEGAPAKRVRTKASPAATTATAAAPPRENLYVQLTGFALSDAAATDAKRFAEATIASLDGAHHFSWDYGAHGKRRTPTHVVAPLFTVNLKTVAAALVGGVWMLTPDWIAASAQAQRWVDEAPFGVRSVAALAQQRVVLTAKLAEALENRKSLNRRRVDPSKSSTVLKGEPNVLRKMVQFAGGEFFDCRHGAPADALRVSGGADVIVVALDSAERDAVRAEVADR